MAARKSPKPFTTTFRNDYASPFMTSTPGAFELANLVARITPDPINHVFFVNSGSESIDTALKMVMAYHRARGEAENPVRLARAGHHGVNIGGVSLSGMVRNRETFTSVMPNVVAMRHTWNADECSCAVNRNGRGYG